MSRRLRRSALLAATVSLGAACSSETSAPRASIAEEWSAGVEERALTGTPGLTAAVAPASTNAGTPGVTGPPVDSATAAPAIASTAAAPTSTTTTTLPAPLPAVAFDVDHGPGGFAGTQGLTGGLGGTLYVVTSDADSGPGTYRDAVSTGDRVVRFDPSLDGATIHLEQPVETSASNLTIDGTGVGVTISGRATRFSGTNIVIAGMHFADNNDDEDDDAVTFREPETTQVFGLFGNLFEHAGDGLVDIIWNRGNDVYATICGNTFRHHDKAMLIDSGDDKEGGRYHVTLCRNHWFDVYQRMPLSRSARVHDYNSLFERYGDPDGNGGGSKSSGEGDGVSQHLLEANMAIPRAEGETTFDGSEVERPRAEWAARHNGNDGAVRAEGTYLATVDGVTASEDQHDEDEVFDPPYDYAVAPAGPELAAVIAATAGTCLPSGLAAAVVPCAPLVLDDPDGVLEIVISPPDDGAAATIASVDFVVGDTSVAGRPVGANRWALDIADLGTAPTPIWAVATTTDGRAVESDLVIVANVS